MEKTRENRIPLLVLAAMLIILLTGCSGGRKLNPTEYVHLELSGLNGKGTGKVVLDGEAIIKVIEEKKDLTTRNREDLEALLTDLQKDFSMSKSEDLSNGDTITVKSDMDKKALKDYGIAIENGSVDLTVEGLIEITEVSLNDYLSSEFTGFEGYGEGYVNFNRDGLYSKIGEIAASVTSKEEADAFLDDDVYNYLYSVNLSQTYFDRLSNGDEITCSISIEKPLIEKLGIQFVFEDYTAQTEGLLPVTTINIMDYAFLEAEGFDGYATAQVYIDKDRLAADLEPIFKEQSRGAYGPLEEGQTVEAEAAEAAETIRRRFSDQFDKALDKNEGLCEGDLVTYDASPRETPDGYIGAGFLLESGTKEFEITGLVPTVEINLIDYAKPTFKGFEGYGTVTLDVDYDAISQYLKEQFESLGRGRYELAGEDTDFSTEVDGFFYSVQNMIRYNMSADITPSGELSNGDVLTASWETKEGVSDYMRDYGVYIRGGKTELTAEGLIPTVTIDVPQFVTTTFSGYNGAGTYESAFDEYVLKTYLKEQFKELGRGAYDLAASDTDYDKEAENAASRVSSMISYNFTCQSPENLPNLSNGDSIEISYALNQNSTNYDERTGLYLNGGKISFQVDGLAQPRQIDVADYVDVTFAGVTPHVSVERLVNDEAGFADYTSLYEFYDDQIYAWNGDTYSFDITYDEQQLLEAGYVITNAHVETTISGLNTYRLSAKTADDPSLTPLWDAFEEEAETQIHAHGNDILYNHENVGLWIVWTQSPLVRERAQIHYISSEENGTGNGLYLIYRFDAVEKGEDHGVQVRPLWYVVGMRNVQETPDGELIYDSSDGSVLYTEQALKDYLAGKKQNLSEDASVEDLLFPEEVSDVQPSGDPQIGVNVSAPQAPAAGEIDSSVLSQATAVITWDGHTYARFDSILPWKQAAEFCQQAGGHLATIRSDREASVVKRLIEEAPLGTYYLGGTDEVYEGVWTWSNGEPFDYDGWADNQPDNYISEEKDEDYLTLSQNNYWMFNDEAFDVEAGYILEADPVEEMRFTWLTDLEAEGFYYAGYREQVTDHFGTDHFGSLYLDASNRASAFYDLKGEWNRLTGTISTFADSQSDASFEIVIWGDDQILFSRYAYKKTDLPMNLDLDLTGVHKLAIETWNKGGYGNGFLFVNDAKLVKGEKAEGQGAGDGAAAEGQGVGESVGQTASLNLRQSATLRAGLKDLPLIGYNSMDIHTEEGLPTDTLGTVHKDAWIFYAADNARAAWPLGGSYETFKCRLLVQDEYTNGYLSAANVQILADGNELWSAKDINVLNGYQELELDVAGAQVLEIITSRIGEDGRPLVFVADTMLTGSEMQSAGEMQTADEVQTIDEMQTAGEQSGAAADAPANDADANVTDKSEATGDEDAAANAAAIIHVEDKTYYRFDEPVNRRTALQITQNAGAKLANPLTEIEEAAFEQLMRKSIYYGYWMGTSDHSYAMSDEDPNQKTGFIIEVTDQDKENALAGSTYLTDLEWIAYDSIDTRNVLISNSDFYPNSVWMYANSRGYLLADLNGQYEKLEASLYCYSENETNSSIQFAVFGDGKLLGEVRNIRRDFAGEALSIDVKGVHQLQICAINTGKDDTAELILATPRLYPASAAVSSTGSVPARLRDLTQVDYADFEADSYVMMDGYGCLADSRQVLNADRSGHVLYNLEGRFTTFTGRFTAGRDTDLSDTASVTILVDGKEVYSTGKWTASNGAVGFEVDVTGATTLELRAESADPDHGTMNVYLTNDQLLG